MCSCLFIDLQEETRETHSDTSLLHMAVPNSPLSLLASYDQRGLWIVLIVGLRDAGLSWINSVCHCLKTCHLQKKEKKETKRGSGMRKQIFFCLTPIFLTGFKGQREMKLNKVQD